VAPPLFLLERRAGMRGGSTSPALLRTAKVYPRRRRGKTSREGKEVKCPARRQECGPASLQWYGARLGPMVPASPVSERVRNAKLPAHE